MSVLFYNAVFGISCYYMVVSFAFCYLEELGHSTDPFAFALLMAAALLAAFGRPGAGTGRLSVLPAAALCLPAFALLWNHGLPGLLEYVPPWLYLAYLKYRRARPLSHFYFKQDFRRLFWIFVFMFLFLFAAPERGAKALKEAVPYIVIFLTAGVSLLQALRHGQEEVEGFAKNQGRRTSIFFLFTILLTAGGFLELLEELLLRRFLLPVGLFLGSCLLGLTRRARDFLDEKFWNFQKDYGDFLEDVEGQRHMREQLDYDPEPILTGHAGQPLKQGEINYMLVAVLVVAAAAIVLFLLLGSSRKKDVSQTYVLDEREALPDNNGAFRRRGKKDTPQESIRKQYQKFMQATDRKAGKLGVQDTTEEIREKYLKGREDEKAAAFSGELTEIYRLARYRGAESARGGMDMGQKAKRMKILLDYLKKV